MNFLLPSLKKFYVEPLGGEDVMPAFLGCWDEIWPACQTAAQVPVLACLPFWACMLLLALNT